MFWNDGEPNQESGAREDKIVLYSKSDEEPWRWIDEFAGASTNGWFTSYKALCEINKNSGLLEVSEIFNVGCHFS